MSKTLDMDLNFDILFKNSKPRDSASVLFYRKTLINILKGLDPRLIVILGPCSIHDKDAAIEYAFKLKEAQQLYHSELFLVMRTYFEKPRTTLGWKGMLYDPYLTGEIDIQTGILQVQELLQNLNQLGVPTATEFLDPLLHVTFNNFISWGAIGARTVESPLYRELASSLPMPIGFKNNTSGNIQIAIDAINTAHNSHTILALQSSGQLKTVKTMGNPFAHLILRGSHHQPNYSLNSLHYATNLLSNADCHLGITVDCSHGNTQKNYLKQKLVCHYLANQIRQNHAKITGIMLESNLVAGRQTVKQDAKLIYGQSITDTCLSWNDTLPLLETLAIAVKERSRLISGTKRLANTCS